MSPATKPLPQLPRGWSRVSHETGLFLRSIGLGILVTAFQGFFTSSFLEPEKVAIRQSRVTALLRALIHAVPLGLAIFEIIINLKGQYVGKDFTKQNILQFVAKGHEIFMQASITTIILSYIRYQISVGKGMPFGAMLGALQISQISYLWSVEFWSAILSKDFQWRKKIYFAVLILSCIIVAATAGPSSANLLIARQGIWPRESEYLGVNGTFLDLWPDRLDDNKVSSDCKMVTFTPAGIPPDGCPLSDIYAILTKSELSIFVRSDLVKYLVEIDLSINEAGLGRVLGASPCFQESVLQTCFTFPQRAFLDGFLRVYGENNLDDETHGLMGFHALKESYYQPYTTGRCFTDSVQNGSDQAPLRFFRLSDTGSELSRNQETLIVPGLSKGQYAHDIEGNSSQFRVHWVDLPQEIFETGVPGVIIVHPQSSTKLSYNITTCTLNAGWGSSEIFTDDNFQSVDSHITQIPPSWPDLSTPLRDAYKNQFVSDPMFRKISNFSYPQRHINISQEWMEFLNPTVVLLDNSTTNLLSQAISQLPSQPRAWELAFILNLFLVTGLSYTGMKLDTRLFKERAQALTYYDTGLVFEIENTILGWGYSARETTTKLAITVMLAYCILVVAHIIYSAISGVSSTAWDSVAELVALATNSSPTRALQNTCAGIIGRTAYQTPVRLLKTGEKHLELVFGRVSDSNANFSKLVMNEKYGSIAQWEDEGRPLNAEMQARRRRRASF